MALGGGVCRARAWEIVSLLGGQGCSFPVRAEARLEHRVRCARQPHLKPGRQAYAQGPPCKAALPAVPSCCPGFCGSWCRRRRFRSWWGGWTRSWQPRVSRHLQRAGGAAQQDASSQLAMQPYCRLLSPTLPSGPCIAELLAAATILPTPFHALHGWGAAATATVDILAVQREATSMPDWAAYKAHMELGFKLGAKQRYATGGGGAAGGGRLAEAARWAHVLQRSWAGLLSRAVG